MTDERDPDVSAAPEADAFGADAFEEEAPPEPAELSELELLVRERDEYLDGMRRIAAEFDNYKKRVARDNEVLLRRANERLVIDLLPVLDDLERAVDAFERHEEQDVAKGVELVHRALRSVLEREGIVEIDPLGEPFDPHRQEALMSQPSPQPEGTVVQVFQKGFLLGDKVVRPARVAIAAAKE